MGPGTDFRKITEQSEARIVLQVIQGRPITKAAIQVSLRISFLGIELMFVEQSRADW
jgi:hypothetical protein